MVAKRISVAVSAVLASAFLLFAGIGVSVTCAESGEDRAVVDSHRAALHSVIEAVAAESFLTPPGAARAR